MKSGVCLNGEDMADVKKEEQSGNVIAPKITGLVVRFKGQRFLAWWLRRLSFYDGLIVIDLGSDDGSEAPASAQDAKVIHHVRVTIVEWAMAFGAAPASGDWMLIFDRDIDFPIESGEAFRRLLVRHDGAGLGMVHVPTETWFGARP